MLLAAMLLSVQTAAEPPLSGADDIVVATERLKRFRAVMRKDRRTGEMRCIVKRRSGDPSLDAGICDAMLACSARITTERDIQPCMAPAMQALLPKSQWTGRKARTVD